MEIVSLLLELISTTYSQSGCDERKGKWGNIIYHILLWGGGGGGCWGSWEIVKFLLSIRLGWGGRTEVPLCSLSPLIAVDNLKLRIDCPPLNNE